MKSKQKLDLIRERSEILAKHLGRCDLCPCNCFVNRLKGERGYCQADKDIVVYTAFLHYGEEPPISGKNGSGTIFFSGCSLKCVFCQNYKFSHEITGRVITVEQLATIMMKLEERGAHNINLVTPTHFLPQILNALALAISKGLSIPIVYNSSGYENKEILSFLDNIVDIYLPDMKYFTATSAEKYSHHLNYGKFNRESIKAMYEQKGNDIFFANDLLQSGIIVRHLVLPNMLDETIQILSWIKENIPQAFISIMFQYQPYFHAVQYPEINRKIEISEYWRVKEYLEKCNLDGWVQDLISCEDLSGKHFSPSFEDFL